MRFVMPAALAGAPRVTSRLILLGLVLIFAAIATRGVAAPFNEGHNGFNGAAFSQAARNSLRFGIVPQAQYHTDLEAPPPGAFYTHHPLMLHGHLVAVFSVFGVSTAGGRMIPVFYGVATLLALFALVRRTNGEHAALVAVAIYVLTPLNLIFANMINHEQGCIFFCLLMVLFHLRWLEEHRARDFLALLLSTTIAAQWDWPAYYLAFFLFLHAAIRSLRVEGLRLSRAKLSIAIFCLVVLLNFFGFLWWVESQRGELTEMGRAFDARFGLEPHHLDRLLEREWFLHGPLLVVLFLGSLVEIVVSLVQRRFTSGHLAALFFVGMQMIHSAVFGHAHFVHLYWIYYLSPAIAIGGALAIESVYTKLSAWLERRGVAEKARRIVLTTVAAVAVAAQSTLAWAHYEEKYETGGDIHNPGLGAAPNLDQIRWAIWLAERYPRGEARYVIHPSLDRTRIDFFFHLDAPYVNGFDFDDAREGVPRLMLLDLDDGAAPRATRAFVRHLSASHALVIVDERFVVAAEGGEPGERMHFFTEPRSVSWLERWLVAPHDTPVRFREGEERPGFVEALEDSAGTSQTVMIGGGGGIPAHFECPDGAALGGLDVVTMENRDGVVAIRDLRSRCGDEVGPWLNRRAVVYGDEEAVTVRCPEDSTVLGVTGRRGALIDALELNCNPPGNEGSTDPVGGDGGRPFALRCPAGAVATGVRGRTGDALDALGLYCGRGL